MPRLLTRISTSGNCLTIAAHPSAPPRSKAAACNLAFGAIFLICAMASSTAARSRPLTMTSAPISARPLAEARPLPRVEPVTSASSPERSRSMRQPPLVRTPLLCRRHDIDFPVSRGRGMPAIEALRRHHQLLGVGGIVGHPLLACRQIPGGRRVADADEAEALCLFERHQSRRPRFALYERRRMIGAVEGERIGNIHVADDDGPAAVKARV